MLVHPKRVRMSGKRVRVNSVMTQPSAIRGKVAKVVMESKAKAKVTEVKW